MFLCYSFYKPFCKYMAYQPKLVIAMQRKKRIGGAKDNPESAAASLFLRFAYALHAKMISTIGMIGYDHTTMTNVHASTLMPESNAMTESPAIMSQITSESKANICETIIQTNKPLRGLSSVG